MICYNFKFEIFGRNIIHLFSLLDGALSNVGLNDEIPDFTTIWRFRERLVRAGLLKRLFDD